VRESKHKEGQSRMSSEDEGYGASRLVVQYHQSNIKFHPSDDFTDISDTTHPNSAIGLTMTHTGLRQYPLYQVNSSDQIIFPFIPYFPMMSHCVSFIIHFLSDLSSDLSCCSMMELSGRFL